MKLWKASTARISQKIALISAHQSVPFFAGVGGGGRRGRFRGDFGGGVGRVGAVGVGQQRTPRARRR